MTFGILEPGDPGYNPDAAPHAGRVYGRRKARVMNVDDPEQRGRVKVFIPGLMTGPATDVNQQTDWADPVMLMGEHPDDVEVGTFVVPPVNTYVWVEFQQGHFDFPIYHGGFWRRNKEIPSLARGADDGSNIGPTTVGPATVPMTTAGMSGYPKNRMMRTPAGHIIEVDDTDSRARIRIRHKSGTVIEMQEDGKLVIHGTDEVDIAAQALNVAVSGAANIAASGEIVIHADTPSLIKIGDNTLTVPLNGVVNGEAIDTFTGSTFATLGNSSTKVAAKKLP